MKKIYVASSWRNAYQPQVVELLRTLGHEVYDFRAPARQTDFRWKELGDGWEAWTPAQFREILQHPVAQRAYASDHAAIEWADTCVLVLPSGRSAHLEAGEMRGAGKRVLVLMPEPCEPELMYSGLPIFISLDELQKAI